MNSKKTLLQKIRTSIGTASATPALIIFIVMTPMNLPAWLVLEFVYAARYGGGYRPVKNPLLTDILARVVSWLTCSAVVATYLLVLQYFHQEYGQIMPPALMPVFVLTVGFVALQGPSLWCLVCGHLGEMMYDYYYASDGVTYSLTFSSPGEDFHVTTITRIAPGEPPDKVGFMQSNESFFSDITIVHATTRSVCVEGGFSTRYFKGPPAPPRNGRNYARGILEITYSTNSTPQMKILHWLPLVPEEVQKTGITGVFSITAPWQNSNSAG